jgi:hypothetical protein
MPIKLINIGDTGSGKTGAMASLCAAGYKVRVADLDNGMEALINLLTDPKSGYPKDSIKNLRWKTFTEPMHVVGGNIQPKAATVWNRAVGQLMDWKGDRYADADGQVHEAAPEDKLGGIYSWGSDTVLCFDTLSTMGTAAMNFHLMMNGNLGKKRTSMEAMRDIGAAQEQLDKFLQMMFDESLKCNVVINTHVIFAKEDGSNIEPGYDGMRYAFPAAIGKALAPKMGKYFNHMLLTKREGGAQRIYTRGLPNVGLKSGAPLKVAASYDVKDGLAKYFEAIQGPLKPAGVTA